MRPPAAKAGRNEWRSCGSGACPLLYGQPHPAFTEVLDDAVVRDGLADHDASPESFDRLVDDLLQRPGYGERWGRHWLDLVRYAETNGYERDRAKPHVWRYRDYVIRAFNRDKPYNQFVVEQLAGDEVEDISPETLIALGYNRLGPWDDEPADFAQDRFDQLDDIVVQSARSGGIMLKGAWLVTETYCTNTGCSLGTTCCCRT